MMTFIRRAGHETNPPDVTDASDAAHVTARNAQSSLDTPEHALVAQSEHQSRRPRSFCRHPREPDVVQVRHIVELAPSCHHDIRLSHYLLPGGTMRNSILIRELAMSTNSPSLAIAGSTTAQDESVMKMPQA